MRTWFLTLIAGLLLIAPSTQAAEKVAFLSNRTGNSDIYVMNPDGTGQTNITNSVGEGESIATWNADGSKLIYTKRSADSSSPINANIYTINPNGTGITSAVIGGLPAQPAFVPNSNKISYSGINGSRYDVFTSNADGSNKIPITKFDTRPYDMYARWNPSGSKFVFYSFDTAGTIAIPDIFIANADGSGEQRLTQNTGYNEYATWRPDGNKLVFQSNRDGNDEIYVMNPDGTSQTRLTNNSYSDTFPVFSPDGSKIMFASNRDGNYEIYVMNANGTNQTRITNNSFDDSFPIWTQVADETTVSVNDISTPEGVANNHVYNFTATLSAPSATPITVTYETYDITAVAGSDYVATSPTTVTFAPGQTTKSLPVSVTGDRLNEANETFGIRLSAVGARPVKSEAIATIPNDDSVPAVRISNLTVPEGAGKTSATYGALVNLSAPSGQYITVKYTTSNGTAEAGSDYEARTGTIVFAPGQTQNGTDVTILGDNILEPNETLFITLSEPTNASIATARGTVTISNDDQFPGLSINDVTVTEGSNAKFTVKLSSAFGSPITVNYSTGDSTAVAGSDYSTRTGTLTIPAGQTSGSVTVPTLTDSVFEPNETFNVTLSDASDGFITDDTGVGTIINTTPPTVYVSDVTIKEGNSGNRMLYFTIALSDPSPVPITMGYSTEDGTASAGSDYTATSGTITFETGQTSQSVAVPIVADTAFENDETFLLNVTATANGVSKTTNGLATIVNDDASAAKSTSNTVSGQGY